jgi:hypothetical protein
MNRETSECQGDECHTRREAKTPSRPRWARPRAGTVTAGAASVSVAMPAPNISQVNAETPNAIDATAKKLPNSRRTTFVR